MKKLKGGFGGGFFWFWEGGGYWERGTSIYALNIHGSSKKITQLSSHRLRYP